MAKSAFGGLIPNDQNTIYIVKISQYKNFDLSSVVNVFSTHDLNKARNRKLSFKNEIDKKRFRFGDSEKVDIDKLNIS
tara:strand:- start:14856 stop:15089 length:234 start_codon:yes stop_codon:yes gene_type:complete